MPKRKYTDSTDRWDVAEDIGCTPGHLNGGGLSAEQRTALKYYCRRWLGMPREQVQGPVDILRTAYDDPLTVADYAANKLDKDAPGIELLPNLDPRPPLETPAPAPAPAPTPIEDDAAAMLAQHLRDMMQGPQTIDEDAVRRIAAEEAAKVKGAVVSHEIKITGKDGIERDLDDQPRHEAFADILTCLAAGRNVLLVGPAGCGKTHMCEQVADAMKRPFRFTGAVASEYKLTGFLRPNGEVVRTPFRDAFEHGGVFLWDELDASAPAAMLAFNGALANGQHDFPDALVPRHETFSAIASANTYGQGADRQYVGRNQMDAASLDRFVPIAIGYDEHLERQLYGDNDWTSYVQKARRAIGTLKIRHVVSMRAVADGRALMEAGMSRTKVETLAIWKHLEQADIAKVKNQMAEA